MRARRIEAPCRRVERALDGRIVALVGGMDRRRHDRLGIEVDGILKTTAIPLA